jgi:Spy/CpxP family protein refolding chaperone
VISARFAVALQLTLVFASGVVVGGLAYRAYSLRSQPVAEQGPPPGGRPGRGGGGPTFRDRYVQEMRDRLRLRQEQVTQLNQILETTGRRFFDAKKKSDMEVRRLQEDQQAQIRAMLDPAQRAEFEKMMQEREAQMKRDFERGRRMRPMPPGGGGPETRPKRQP